MSSSEALAGMNGLALDAQCQICLKKAVEAWEHSSCGKFFCEACLEETGRDKPCPSCKVEQPQYTQDGKSESDIQALIEKCETEDVFETVPNQEPEQKQKEQNNANNKPKRRKESVAFDVTDFTAKKESNSEYSCPSFYTGPEGYHMAVRVGTNGDGDAKGTHISLYACIVKGEHDRDLDWPFVGEITVTLLNQIEDKNHSHMVVKIEPADNVQVDSSWGIATFIPHSKLDHDPQKNTQYLKDDTLHFRVSVEVPQNGT